MTYGESYRVHDTVPPGRGGTAVAGTSIQLTPGGTAYVVSDTAFRSRRTPRARLGLRGVASAAYGD